MSLSRFACRTLVSGIARRAPTSISSSALASSFLRMNSSPVSTNFLAASMSGTRTFATKSDEDLVQFLSEEIKAEKGNQKPLPSLQGFKVESEGADLTFKKDFNGEQIIVQLNVNHTVDSAEPDDGTQEAPEMKSKPNFEVDIVKKGGKTLSFSCSYIYERENPEGGAAQEEGYDDVFAIDEVTLFEGEWNEKKYAVAGDILDGYLYDLLMNMLEERGVNAEFAEKMSEYCSSYEHSQYINLLEGLQQFVKK